MAVDTRSVFAEEIDVGVTIEGGEGATVARGKCYGERVGVEDGPCITAWQVLAG